MKTGALGDIRVLDLAGPLGVYCTKLLADLGADVIKVEPPEGDAMRRMPPFYHDVPHPDRSLYWFYFNTNKRSITLNLEASDGREIFKQLAKSADVVVETFLPGGMGQLGLDYPVLKELNPRLILTSITGFGQTGPYRDFKAPDIVGMAMGGLMYLTGFPDRPPVRLDGYQGYHVASTQGAVGTLLALYHRDVTGEGQHVDVSMQGSVLKTAYAAVGGYWTSRKIVRRVGLEFYRGLRETFRCKDGYVICSVLAGGGADIMLDWMDSEGMAGDLKDEKYAEMLAAIGSRRRHKIGAAQPRYDPRRLGDYSQQIHHAEEVWEAWLMTHTREELFHGAQRKGVRLLPMYSPKDTAEDPALNEYGFFVPVEHPELGTTVKYPGAPYRLSQTPARIRRRAPRLGEHNFDVYVNEMGMTQETLSSLRDKGVI